MRYLKDISRYLVLRAVELPLAEAEPLYKWAVELHPGSLDAVNGLGRVATERKDWATALMYFRQCLAGEPDNAAFLLNASVAYFNLDNFQEALKHAIRSISLDDSLWLAWHHLACIYRALTEYDKSIEASNRALALQPPVEESRLDVLLSRGFTLLSTGNWRDGWLDWQSRNARRKISKYMADCSGIPEWQGQDLQGKRVLIVGEDGLGDQVMFARWVPQLIAMGADVTIGVQPGLENLLALALGVPVATEVRISDGNWSYWIGFGSLPVLLGMDQAVQPLDLTRFRKPAASDKLKVGIAWKGNQDTPVDPWRPADLKLWRGLLSSPGVEFHSFQYKELPPEGCVPQMLTSDIVGTCEELGTMDLVITADTLIAHLAGSIGVPTWMLLYTPPEWRWAAGFCWYPSIRIFQQKSFKSWGPVFRDLESELHSLVAKSAAA